MATDELAVRVQAPSRLHFGLLAFGAEASPRQFGGVGVMIQQPGNELVVRPAAASNGRSGPGGAADARAAEFLAPFRQSLAPGERSRLPHLEGRGAPAA